MSDVVDVTLIRTKNMMSLVEYAVDGSVRRMTVPAQLVSDDGKASLSELSAQGTPYGEAWEHMIALRMVTPQMFANALRKRGIWTADDLLARPAAAMSAIQEVHGFELRHLLMMVRGR